MAGLAKSSGVGTLPSPDHSGMMSGLAKPYMAALTMPLSGSLRAAGVMAASS